MVEAEAERTFWARWKKLEAERARRRHALAHQVVSGLVPEPEEVP
jgi:hypothetical protein